MTKFPVDADNLAQVHRVHREISDQLLDSMLREHELKRRSVIELRLMFLDGKPDRSEFGATANTKY